MTKEKPWDEELWEGNLELRIKTFPYLDRILDEGISPQNMIIINDTPAANGYLLADQIFFQEMDRNRYGVFMAFDHSAEMVRQKFKAIGFDSQKYEEEGKLFILNCFKFVEKSGPFAITDPSNRPEVIRPFREINKVTKGRMKNNTVCVVDSLVSLATLYSVQHVISFSLLMREMSIKYGCTIFMIAPQAIDKICRCLELIEYNSDVVIEFRIRDHEKKSQPMLRVKRLGGSPPSGWLPFVVKKGVIKSIGISKRKSKE
ncbi:MAG: RAD55 family ATPase [Promethearchaeota archaeon]